MTRAQVDGNSDLVMHYMMEFYFESAAMILTLITVGKMLEARSKGKTTDALKGLMKLAPKTAVVIRNGQEATVPIDQVVKGDTFVVRPGENIPVDGVIIEGSSAVNESALQVRVSLLTKLPEILSPQPQSTSLVSSNVKLPALAKTPPSPRSSKWSVMLQPPKLLLQKSQTVFPVFSYLLLSPLQL